MDFKKIFSTVIAQGQIRNSKNLNRQLLSEIKKHSQKDGVGKQWSAANYKEGYTSYASLSDMHHRSPLFQELSERMRPHVNQFAKEQNWIIDEVALEMNSCWMNVMRKHAYHSSHLHPHSIISGVYYISVPAGSVSLRLEDPRMMFLMNAPVRKGGLYLEVHPQPGSFILFESWLRHEVPPNRSLKPRVSVSFNYSIEND